MVRSKLKRESDFSLPDYTVRESLRAKHVRLKVSIEGGIEVIVPEGFDQTEIPQILRKKQNWLQNANARVEQYRQLYTAESSTQRPDSLFLRVVEQIWTVEYQQQSSARIRVVEQKRSRRLIVKGQIDDEMNCKLALKQWIAGKADEHLVPWLRELSETRNLPFGRVSIRGQKTRWASCSCRHDISLNFKLLFLPPHLVQYVLLHELSHTIHLNHSKDFWEFVRTQEPDYKSLDRELKDAWCYVPLWLESLNRKNS